LFLFSFSFIWYGLASIQDRSDYDGRLVTYLKDVIIFNT
jgi:hypothetical protein